MDNERMYTTQQVAERLNVSDAHVRRMMAEGKATPSQQIGGTWLFPESEVVKLERRPRRRSKQQTE